MLIVFLFFQAAVTSSTGTQCLLAASSVTWSFLIFRPRSISMTTTSPEARHHGYNPQHTHTHLYLLIDGWLCFLSGGGSDKESVDKLFNIIYSIRLSPDWTQTQTGSSSEFWQQILFFPEDVKQKNIKENPRYTSVQGTISWTKDNVVFELLEKFWSPKKHSFIYGKEFQGKFFRKRFLGPWKNFPTTYPVLGNVLNFCNGPWVSGNVPELLRKTWNNGRA